MSSSFGVVRHRHDGTVRIELQFEHQVVGMALLKGGARHVPRGGIPRADRSRSPSKSSVSAICTEDARQLSRADDQHAPAQTEQRAQAARRTRTFRRATAAATTAPAPVERARHQLVARGAGKDLVDPRRALQRLLHQAQVAAAGRPKRAASSLVTPGHERGPVDAFAVAHALDQVVLDAAARHRADDEAVPRSAR